MEENKKNYELLLSLQRTEDRLSFVEKLSGIGYVEMDIKSRKIYISDQILNMLGYKDQNPHQLNLQKIMAKQDYDHFLKDIGRLYHNKLPINGQFRLKRLDKTWRYCLWHGAYFKMNGNEILAGTIQDLSELISLNKKLKSAQKQTEKLSRDKALFWAQASHDLRQPLMALCLYLDMFPKASLNQSQKKVFEKIVNSADNLRNLLNNFLDLSKLDYSTIKPSSQKFNIGLLLSSLGKEFNDIAEQTSVNFEYSICNCLVKSDPFLIERLLRNLLSNAFKFARKRVGMYCHETNNGIILEIKDDGKGISPKEQSLIFKEFYRGKNATEKQIDGAGLGLAIVKKIAKLLNLKISVQSEEGKSAIFRFELPKG